MFDRKRHSTDSRVFTLRQTAALPARTEARVPAEHQIAVRPSTHARLKYSVCYGCRMRDAGTCEQKYTNQTLGKQMIPNFKGHHFVEDSKPGEPTVGASLRPMRIESCTEAGRLNLF